MKKGNLFVQQNAPYKYTKMVRKSSMDAKTKKQKSDDEKQQVLSQSITPDYFFNYLEKITLHEKPGKYHLNQVFKSIATI